MGDHRKRGDDRVGSAAGGGDKTATVQRIRPKSEDGRDEKLDDALSKQKKDNGCIVKILPTWFLPYASLSFLLASPGLLDGQTSLEKEISGIKKELADIKKELGEIKSLLKGSTQTQARQETISTVSIVNKPTLGRQDAPVTMVEFSDYECPFCKQYFSTVYPILKKDYVDAGKLRIVFRDFPIAGLHPRAKKAHEAAHCAGEQGQYWKMHDTLFENSGNLSVAALQRYAEMSGLEVRNFNDCLNSGKYSRRLDEELAEGAGAGVRATPTFFIGPTGLGEKISGKMLVGAQSLARFRELIDEMLKNPGRSKETSTPGP